MSTISQELSITFGPELVVSTMVELVGMPALIIWLSALTKSHPCASRSYSRIDSPPGADRLEPESNLVNLTG